MESSEARSQFATSLRRWRNRRGFSQEELAERADLHRTYISDVERGARNLSLESINKLANALEISLPILFSSPEAENGEANGAAAAKPPEPAPTFVDLLLVEDNPDDIELTLAAFKTRSIPKFSSCRQRWSGSSRSFLRSHRHRRSTRTE